MSSNHNYVAMQLREKAELFNSRSAVYGDTYKNFGKIMKPLVGEVNLKSEIDFSRFGVLVQIVSKLARYCKNYSRGGHNDSLDDLAVYAMMLKELDAALQSDPRTDPRQMCFDFEEDDEEEHS